MFGNCCNSCGEHFQNCLNKTGSWFLSSISSGRLNGIVIRFKLHYRARLGRTVVVCTMVESNAILSNWNRISIIQLSHECLVNDIICCINHMKASFHSMIAPIGATESVTIRSSRWQGNKKMNSFVSKPESPKIRNYILELATFLVDKSDDENPYIENILLKSDD